MAYQQPGGMNGGQVGPGDHHAPQGTEYTLQGELASDSGQLGSRDGRSSKRVS